MTTQAASCDVLNLLLGPLDLNLLGLRVQLNQVDLDITAEQGPGNLLGNLLCAVAGLLDGPAALNSIIAQLLNYTLGIIGRSPSCREVGPAPDRPPIEVPDLLLGARPEAWVGLEDRRLGVAASLA